MEKGPPRQMHDVEKIPQRQDFTLVKPYNSKFQVMANLVEGHGVIGESVRGQTR